MSPKWENLGARTQNTRQKHTAVQYIFLVAVFLRGLVYYRSRLTPVLVDFRLRLGVHAYLPTLHFLTETQLFIFLQKCVILLLSKEVDLRSSGPGPHFMVTMN